MWWSHRQAMTARLTVTIDCRGKSRLEAKGHSAFKKPFALQLSSFFLSSTLKTCLATLSFAWKEKQIRTAWDNKSENKRKSNSATNKYKGQPPSYTHSWLFFHLSICMIKIENNIYSKVWFPMSIFLAWFFFILHFMCVLLLTEMPVMIEFERCFRLGLASASSSRASRYQLPSISSVFSMSGSELLM